MALNKKLFIRLIVLSLLLSGTLIFSCSMLYDHTKKSLEKNIHPLPLDQSIHREIVHDLKWLKVLTYVPIVRTKAVWAYEYFRLTLSNELLLKSKKIYNEQLTSIYHKVNKAGEIYYSDTLRLQSVRDSILANEVTALDSNVLGSYKETFCNQWGIILDYLVESGFEDTYKCGAEHSNNR